MGNAALNYLFTNETDMVLEFTVVAVLELLAPWKGQFQVNNREMIVSFVKKMVCSSQKNII